MLKILQITSIAVTILAIGIIILAVTGSASDAKTDELLSSPGVAEKLQASYSGKKTSETDTDTPLMRQAKIFALRIDPPPPPAPPKPVQRSQNHNEPIRPRVDVSAKFTLVGTSYNVGDEANSWALINEVGKGFHWVRLGGTVGYLRIEKIGSGSVLIRDGEKTYEMTAERTQKADFVKSYTGTTPSISVPDIWKGVEKPSPAAPETQTPVIKPENTQIPEQQAPEPVPEPNAAEIQANIDWIKQIKENPESLGMTAEEAKELGELGDMLKDMEAQKERVNSEPNAANKPIENTSPATDANVSKQPPTKQRPADVNDDERRSRRAEMLKARRRR